MTHARTLPIHLRVSPETLAAIARRAELERRPVATMAALMLEDAVKQPQADGPAPSPTAPAPADE